MYFKKFNNSNIFFYTFILDTTIGRSNSSLCMRFHQISDFSVSVLLPFGFLVQSQFKPTLADSGKNSDIWAILVLFSHKADWFRDTLWTTLTFQFFSRSKENRKKRYDMNRFIELLVETDFITI